MKNYKFAMTLLEVIASMFIICIGLLSVLMVIPYGAFQVAKARNAEYISNMLAAGAEELQIARWDSVVTEREGTGKGDFGQNTTAQIHIIDPFVTHSLSGVFTTESAPNRERMTGTDDLNFILKEGRRTEIKFSDANNRVASSGQYTYFVTIKPRDVKSEIVGIDSNFEPYEAITEIRFTTDLLGCYQRVGTDTAFEVTPTSSQYYHRAAKFTIPADSVDFATTKYVFITWESTWTAAYNHPDLNTRQHVMMNRGEWCKIVSASNNANGSQDIIVLSNDVVSVRNSQRAENLPDSDAPVPVTVQIFVFPGVMYHKRIYD
ncbi:MAG: hypothetical protein LBT09_09945 [Planctomycetaceae bacterium]|jgi:hypothetical protein|nr:hypothetical protein [Planctomycetaceae bacterium]